MAKNYDDGHNYGQNCHLDSVPVSCSFLCDNLKSDNIYLTAKLAKLALSSQWNDLLTLCGLCG